ncbi:MAG: hypothetical protein V7K57_14910 [Nostoc sp.]|uniref:hypothetical protein n=1 Tax=Nostoc sp. TaxID=1180 RepID=UPI002FF54AA9
MRPEYWHPPRELNASEEKIVKRIKRAKLFTFIGRWQGKQARYVGCRKNLFDLRRTAVVYNLHVLATIFTSSTDATTASL